MPDPVAYFLSFTAYGTWLHGRDPGSVDRDHDAYGSPVLPPDPGRERAEQTQLRDPPYRLDADRRAAVLSTVAEVAAHRRWQLWAAHVRTNHVHVVLTARDKPEKVMSDLKAYIEIWKKERAAETVSA